MSCGSRFVRLFLAVAILACTAAVTAAFAPVPPLATSRTATSASPVTRYSRRKPTSGTTAWFGGGVSRWNAIRRSAGPAILEKEAVRTGGPAVLDRPDTLTRPQQQRTEEPRKERKGLGSEAWEVRIYNDGMNTREHVARALVQVTGMSEMDAYQTMMQAHMNGIAVVGRYLYEVAEMFHDALKKNGIVCDIVPVDEDL